MPIIDYRYFNWDYTLNNNSYHIKNHSDNIDLPWSQVYYKCYRFSLAKLQRQQVRGF